MDNRGISAVVATVMTILITVVGVSVIWLGVTPLLQKGTFVDQCDVDLEILTTEGYTTYDSEKEVIQVQVKRGNDDFSFDRILIILNFDGNSYDDVFDAPSAGQTKAYLFNVSSISQDKRSLNEIKVVPVFEEECDVGSIYGVKVSEGKIVDLPYSLKEFGVSICENGENSTDDCICDGSFKTCEDGQWGNCSVLPDIENCIDGLDNDCDGFIDEEDSDCGNVNFFTLFNKTYEGSGNVFYSVQQTSDYGYIAAGVYEYNGWLLKTNSNGEEDWNYNFYGGSRGGQFNSVQQTSDGGYILVGDYSGTNGWLLKTNSNGEKEWSKTFEYISYNSAFNSVQQVFDSEGYNDGYIIVGYYELGCWLLKTDSSGNEQWNKTFDGLGRDTFNSVQQTSDGGYIVVGKFDEKGWLLKTDSSGNEQWNSTFGESSIVDTFNSVQQTSDGGYIVIGTEDLGRTSGSLWLLKVNSTGDEKWSRTFGGIGEDRGYSVQQTSDGGYLIAGAKALSGRGAGDFWLIKVDSSGNEQWNEVVGESGDSRIYSLKRLFGDDYIAAGSIRDTDDFFVPWLIKIRLAD